MEFRRYNKINCSLFDLIDGDIEVKQTMALGYLFSESEDALMSFLRLTQISKPTYDKYIVDCEAKEIGRIDILIRFYKNYLPIKAIIVEAKSVRASTTSLNAAKQVVNYSKYSQLKGFNKVNLVTITREVSINQPVNEVISISWSQLISKLHDIVNYNKHDSLIKSFISFIINIEGNMKYYEEEILSIPAGVTINAVLKTGIYECPEDYDTHKKSLFLAFRASGKRKSGEMDKLFKLKEKFELDLNDQSAIDAINMDNPDFKTRITNYKKEARYDTNCHDIKQVYLLDLENPIELSIPVRPMENNAPPVYYSLHSFIQKTPNSNIDRIIVQKSVWVDNKNVLHVDTKGKKIYTLKCGDGKLFVFRTKGQYNLYPYYKYTIEIRGANKAVRLKKINVNFDGFNHKWVLSYIF